MSKLAEQAQHISDLLDTPIFPLTVGLEGPQPPEAWQEGSGSKDASAFSWVGKNGYGIRLDNLVCVDIDNENVLQREGFPTDIPSTTVVRSSRGLHLYYRGNTDTKSLKRFGYDVDVKSGNGAFMVGPGSLHKSLIRYQLISEDQPQEFSHSPFKPWFEAVTASDKEQQSSIEHITTLHEGTRNDGLMRVMGYIFRYNLPKEAVEPIAKVLNHFLCDPPLPDKELENTIIKSVREIQPEREIESLANLLSDISKVSEKVLTPRELVEQVEEPESIIRGVWPESAVSILSAKTGSYKTFIAMDLAARISDARSLIEDSKIGHIPQPKRVLYCIGEGVASWKKRILAAGIEDSEFVIYPERLDLFDLTGSGIISLKSIIEEQKIEVCIIDTLQMYSGDMDENSSRDIRKLFGALRDIYERYAVSFLLVHHHGKSEMSAFRGSSALTADATNAYKLVNKTAKGITLASEVLKDIEPVQIDVHIGKDENLDTLYIDKYTLHEVKVPKIEVDPEPYTSEDVERILLSELDDLKHIATNKKHYRSYVFERLPLSKQLGIKGKSQNPEFIDILSNYEHRKDSDLRGLNIFKLEMMRRDETAN